MLLLRAERLPEGPNWLYELKLDGYRALAIKSGGKVRLRSLNELVSKCFKKQAAIPKENSVIVIE